MRRGRCTAPAVALLVLESFGGVWGESSALCLRLRGSGSRELKIEHRAFVANLPRTLTDKGLREVCLQCCAALSRNAPDVTAQCTECLVRRFPNLGRSRKPGSVFPEHCLICCAVHSLWCAKSKLQPPSSSRCSRTLKQASPDEWDM